MKCYSCLDKAKMICNCKFFPLCSKHLVSHFDEPGDHTPESLSIPLTNLESQTLKLKALSRIQLIERSKEKIDNAAKSTIEKILSCRIAAFEQLNNLAQLYLVLMSCENLSKSLKVEADKLDSSIFKLKEVSLDFNQVIEEVFTKDLVFIVDKQVFEFEEEKKKEIELERKNKEENERIAEEERKNKEERERVAEEERKNNEKREKKEIERQRIAEEAKVNPEKSKDYLGKVDAMTTKERIEYFHHIIVKQYPNSDLNWCYKYYKEFYVTDNAYYLFICRDYLDGDSGNLNCKKYSGLDIYDLRIKKQICNHESHQSVDARRWKERYPECNSLFWSN